MVMTVVLPGSAQLVAGNKRVGRIAVRTAVAAFGLVAAVVVTGLVSESSVISLFTKLWSWPPWAGRTCWWTPGGSPTRWGSGSGTGSR